MIDKEKDRELNEFGVLVNDTKHEREGGSGNLQIASIGVAYNADTILWDNLGSNRLMFMQYHQEFQKAYEELATQIYKEFGVQTQPKAYGVEINAFGKKYIFSKDYVTGTNVMAGDDTVFANYILHNTDIDSNRIKGKYLTKEESEEVRHVAVEQFIILPTEVDMRLKEKLVTLTLKRPKDWITEFQHITKLLGVDVPKIWMEKGDILIQEEGKLKSKKHKVQWKYDKDSVKQMIYIMCMFWEKDEKSNRKPDNHVVRGGGITIVNLTKEQRDYREYIDGMVKKALSKTSRVSDVYKITFSNTTTSCYVDFTNVGLYDLKISIRDHEEMRENGYYRFYIDAVGREDFSNRLALVIDALVKERKRKLD